MDEVLNDDGGGELTYLGLLTKQFLTVPTQDTAVSVRDVCIEVVSLNEFIAFSL